MSVSADDVLRIAALARLRPAPDTVARLTRELNSILRHAAELAEADTSAADAIAAADWAAPLRPDRPGPDPLHLPLADLAPGWAEGFFTVPRLAALGGGAAAPEDGGA
jgi:aspartyl/glutamyl-tRNA(Asn/Gln) amidotransferase C subunit